MTALTLLEAPKPPGPDRLIVPNSVPFPFDAMIINSFSNSISEFEFLKSHCPPVPVKIVISGLIVNMETY